MLRIDCKFPGGNIKVHDILGDTVYISPDLRGSDVPWFYWAFRVTGAEGRTLVFRFLSGFPVPLSGPVVSEDGMVSWRHGTEAWDEGAFRIRFRPDVVETYVAFAPVYTQSNWERFVARLGNAESPGTGEYGAIGQGMLAVSQRGRQVELLHVGAPDEKARHHIVITSRHIASASVASLVLEGIVAEIAGGAGEDGEFIRRNLSFSIVPFVDKDGVEEGRQGRGRAPHDYYCDYGGAGRYQETRAVRAICRDTVRRFRGLDLFLDIECPGIRGEINDAVHFSGLSGEDHLRRRFAEETGKALAENSLPVSLTEVGAQQASNGESSNESPVTWASALQGCSLAASIEIPYATWSSARNLGASIARGITRYFRGLHGFAAEG